MVVIQDLRVTELLASRICHDLISPVGAINNGIELLEEMGAQIGEEAVRLIGHSAEQASRRLRLFRLAYGGAGADKNLTCTDVLATARDYIAGSRVTLEWDEAALRTLPVPRGTPKVLLNVVLMAVEVLVHGGVIRVAHDLSGQADPVAAVANTEAREEQKEQEKQGDYPSGRQILRVVAQGRGAGQRDEAWPALRGEVSVEDLTARSVHPHVVSCFAKAYDVEIAWEQDSEDRLEFSLAYRSAEASNE